MKLRGIESKWCWEETVHVGSQFFFFQNFITFKTLAKDDSERDIANVNHILISLFDFLEQVNQPFSLQLTIT